MSYIPFKTEAVCDECGSSNIGHDAWVKNIQGELVVVGGPFDDSKCLNEHCGENDPSVRDVRTEDLKYCDGKDCDYNGDKGVMTNKPIASEGTYAMSGGTLEPYQYWYCSRCTEEANVPEEEL
jgi:hypothetical protein